MLSHWNHAEIYNGNRDMSEKLLFQWISIIISSHSFYSRKMQFIISQKSHKKETNWNENISFANFPSSPVGFKKTKNICMIFPERISCQFGNAHTQTNTYT